jgi:hypothetical protein
MEHADLLASILVILMGVALFVQGARLRLKMKEPVDPAQPGTLRRMLPFLAFQSAGIFAAIMGSSWLIRLVR